MVYFQALDEMSKPSAVMNGKIPKSSAHAAGLRVSTNNPNVFFRETSLGGEEIASIQGVSSLERDRNHRNRKQHTKKHKNGSNDNKRRKRNNDDSNEERREMEERNRHQMSSGKASHNVTTESAIINRNAVSMDTRNGGNGIVTKGHIVVLPPADGWLAGSKSEGGWGNIIRFLFSMLLN